MASFDVVLQNADRADFSIYIHSEPGFVFDKSTTRSEIFFHRQLGNNIKVTSPFDSLLEYGNVSGNRFKMIYEYD